jgi:hypothetical protein
MSPAAIAFNDANNGSNGKHYVVKPAIKPADTVQRLTSADVIRMEHDYGAHK